MSFKVTPWRDDLHSAHASDWKEPIYRLLRPALDVHARSFLAAATLAQFRPERVIYKRGFPAIARRRWACHGASLTAKTLVVQGTGNGWDVASWAQFKPRRIIGVDLFPFDSWPEVTAHVRQAFGVEAEFHATSLDDLSFLGDRSVDMVASDAVFEHVKDVHGVLRETRRVLRPGGRAYVAYGPLWFAAGGDHFSGRGGLLHAFNHLLLDAVDYQAYFDAQKTAVENFQSGGRYVVLDLFSKLTTAEYVAAFRAAGFDIDAMMLEVSPISVQFEQVYGDLFRRLLALYPRCNRDDFLITANFVRLHSPP